MPGATGQVGGGTLLFDAITGQVEKDLVAGELIALPVSLLVMVLVFGGFLAAGMPILGAIASIGGALASLLGFSYLIDLDAAVVNVVTVLGLGLCIDYGLLIVSRYREELRAQLAAATTRSTRAARTAALVATMTTAGRTVLFSGVTVAISLSGLLVFQARILRAVGAAGVSVVVVALLVALTLVPALLALAGATDDPAGAAEQDPGRAQADRSVRRRRSGRGLLLPVGALDPTPAVAGGRRGAADPRHSRRARAADGAAQLRRPTAAAERPGAAVLRHPGARSTRRPGSRRSRWSARRRRSR